MPKGQGQPKNLAGQFASQHSGGLTSSDPLKNPLCQDPCRLAWERLQHHFDVLHNDFKDDKTLASECGAAASVIHRVLRCQESDAQALTAVRAVFTKLSTLLNYTGHYAAHKNRLEAIQASLEDLCRLVPSHDCGKPQAECTCGTSSAYCDCSEGPGLETGFTNYGQWLEVETSGALVWEAMARFGKTLDELGPHLPHGGKLKESHDRMARAASDFALALKKGRSAAGSCEPKEIADALEYLHNEASRLTSAYDQLQCELAQSSCTAQPAFFAVLQAEADGIGLLGATLLRAIHKLAAPCSAAGSQLKKVWTEMRLYTAGPLRQAFCRYEEQQLCPSEHCYEKATTELRAIIEHGVADCDGLALDAYGCDENRFQRHSHLVDLAVQEVMKLDCKHLEGFDRCVWTRLGSFTMRLYAILGRPTNIIADQVRTLVDSLRHLKHWFNNMNQEPPQDVIPFLRAGLAILRSLEDRAYGYGVCAQVPTGPCDYGHMVLRIVDDNDQPISHCKVHITTQTGQKREAIADIDGNIRELLPKGPYTVSATGGEFPALMMVVQ